MTKLECLRADVERMRSLLTKSLDYLRRTERTYRHPLPELTWHELANDIGAALAETKPELPVDPAAEARIEALLAEPKPEPVVIRIGNQEDMSNPSVVPLEALLDEYSHAPDAALHALHQHLNAEGHAQATGEALKVALSERRLATKPADCAPTTPETQAPIPAILLLHPITEPHSPMFACGRCDEMWTKGFAAGVEAAAKELELNWELDRPANGYHRTPHGDRVRRMVAAIRALAVTPKHPTLPVDPATEARIEALLAEKQLAPDDEPECTRCDDGIVMNGDVDEPCPTCRPYDGDDD